MSEEITGPVDKVTNVRVDLGPRIIMAGIEVLGTSDNISIVGLGSRHKDDSAFL